MSFVCDEQIEQYYAALGLKAIQPKNIWGAIKAIGNRNNRIIVSDNRMYRAVGKLCNIPRIPRSSAILSCENHFAFTDALKLLSVKKVPVFFFNRVGLKKDAFKYDSLAQERMDKGLNFPLMASNPQAYSKHFIQLIGEDYSLSYLDNLQKIPQIVKKGNIYSHEDRKSELVNVVNGKRVTLYSPGISKKRLHLYGRCGAFGYAVSDEQTLASQIQKRLSSYDIEVINHGLWGGEDKHILHNFFNEIAGYNEDDIIVFYMMHFEKKLIDIYDKLGLYYIEITDDWHKYNDARWCFYDKPGHMNAIGYNNAAELIVKNLIAENFKYKHVSELAIENLDARYLNDFLKTHKDNKFEKEVENYVKSIVEIMPHGEDGELIGSIVMNCNPFTNGHRYLVEYASKQVDKLIIFVVEEDRSFFKFADRLDMVKQGVADLKNVIVVPSGNFIISTLTFPEYFLKDYVKEKNFDVSQDLETFCSLIAKPLNISVRFAGEEPFDPVTKNYNESMERILPLYNMRFVEIPRFKLEGDSEAVNATKVRKLLADRNFDELKRFVPITTLNIIMERYV